jgi:hypothetical protein
VIGHDIRQFEARNLILNSDYQFEAIEPVSAEVITSSVARCGVTPNWPAIILRTLSVILLSTASPAS